MKTDWLTITVLWDVVLCSVVETNQHFRNAYCLHHQGTLMPEGSVMSVNICIPQHPIRQSSSYSLLYMGFSLWNLTTSHHLHLLSLEPEIPYIDWLIIYLITIYQQYWLYILCNKVICEDIMERWWKEVEVDYFKIYLSICLKQLWKTIKESLDSWSLGWVLNPGPPEYEAGVSNQSLTMFRHRAAGDGIQCRSAYHWNSLHVQQQAVHQVIPKPI
jgi:hypothetical protein